jgi:uncharacterized protein
MKIQLETAGAGANIIRNYAPGQVTINEDTYRCSLLVSAERIITDWPPAAFDELSSSHFESIKQLAPEVVILGTGRRLRFPAAAVTWPLTAAQVGLEVMDTGAACRTYNVLVSDGRKVVAALLMIEE